MKSELMHIEFYYPKENESLKNKEHLADLIVDEMREKESISYSGHLDEKSLKDGIVAHLGNADISQYKKLSGDQEKQIKEEIEKIISDSNKVLPIPTKNYIFFFPYIPTEKDKDFGGIMGVAQYSCVFHIYLSPDHWSSKDLANTITHELNHTIFYYRHFDNFKNYSLLEEMLMEGLAENFKEQVAEKEASPWAVALNKKEAFSELASLNELLDSKDKDLHREVLFGSEKYKKWTGYSVGYWLVKDLINKKPDLSWDQIMKLDSSEFLKVIK